MMLYDVKRHKYKNVWHVSNATQLQCIAIQWRTIVDKRTLWGKGLDSDADEEKNWNGGCVSSKTPTVSLNISLTSYHRHFVLQILVYMQSPNVTIFQNIYFTLQASECNVYNILENYHKKEKINSPRQKVYIDLMIWGWNFNQASVAHVLYTS